VYNCPVCTCFNVIDRSASSDASKRVRLWDTCMFKGFTRTAGGVIPAEAKINRTKRWFHHKLIHWPEQFGAFGCVGCGRCAISCPGTIDMATVALRIKGEGKAEEKNREDLRFGAWFFIMTTTNIYLPFKTSITNIKEVAKDVNLFSISVPPDFTYQAGQFVMASVIGAGEVPISITSTPGVSKDLELCVRTVGHVSAAINALTANDAVWLRGPYGRPFPVNGRQDSLFICGGIGIVPLRR
jgi:ferredoxin